MIVTLTPEMSLKALKLSKRNPPLQIQKLKEEIEGKIRVAELRSSLNDGVIDESLVQEIVNMKRQLDGFYCSLIL